MAASTETRPILTWRRNVTSYDVRQKTDSVVDQTAQRTEHRECYSNTNHTYESLLRYAVTLQQNAQVSTRPKAWNCGRWFAGIAGSNSAGGMDICLCECCVLSGRGLCVGLITRPEGSYRLRCVLV